MLHFPAAYGRPEAIFPGFSALQAERIDHPTQETAVVVIAGERLEATWNHPFYVQDGGWTPAVFLRVGDRVATAEGWRAVEALTGSVRLSVEGAASNIKLYEDANRTTSVTLPRSWSIDELPTGHIHEDGAEEDDD